MDVNRQISRTQISYYINPVDGHRGALKEMGKKVINHISVNKNSLKNLENTNKIKQLPNDDSENKLFKLKQFNDIKSKLTS